jgi:mannose-1-phosphate guanylyltransferase
VYDKLYEFGIYHETIFVNSVFVLLYALYSWNRIIKILPLVVAMKALILAAGHGKRLGLEDKNKVMLELKDGRPVIAHIVDYLLRHEMEPVIAVARSTFGDSIIDYFKGDKRVSFSIADEPTGTAGDIYHARHLLEKEKDFLVYFGDTLADVDLGEMLRQHRAEGNLVTLCGTGHAIVPYGLISDDEEGYSRVEEKPDFEYAKYKYYVNCPVFYAGSDIFGIIRAVRGENTEADFFGQILPRLYSERRKVHKYFHRGFYYDIGTKKSYETVRELDLKLK